MADEAHSATASMPIGMFSRASLLSIKALRSYHRQGLLVPAEVDPNTGYRFYHTAQLADAAVLRRLRGLDLPLADVHEVLKARDPEVTRKVLDSHRHEMERRLVETERIVAELQAAAELPAVQTPVHVRVTPNTHALSTSSIVSADDFAAFLGSAFELLYQTVTATTIPAGPSGALYQPEVHDHDMEPVTAYVPVTTPAPIPPGPHGMPMEVIELPQTTMAVVVHHGGYDSIGDTYAVLGAWVARHATPSGAQVRETYLVSVQDSSDPASYRTEIAWPISGYRDETNPPKT